jgi:AcrR family transcriptional regulator
MGRREENKAQKRDRLLTEGLRLFLDQGYDRASIEQVAAAADVARGTFYLYFPNKLALFDALVERWTRPLLEAVADADRKLQNASTKAELFGIYLEMAQRVALIAFEHKQEMLLGFREARHPGEAGESHRRRELAFEQAATELTKHAASKGLIVIEDPRITTLVILGAVERLFYEWLRGEDFGDPLTQASMVLAIVGRALALDR